VSKDIINRQDIWREWWRPESYLGNDMWSADFRCCWSVVYAVLGVMRHIYRSYLEQICIFWISIY